MTLNEALNVTSLYVDKATGKEITHDEYYDRVIDYLGGLRAVIPFIPFTRKQIADAYPKDNHLNNLPLRKWDAATGLELYDGPPKRSPSGRIIRKNDLIATRSGLWRLLRCNGINVASLSECVCILKRAASLWLLEEEEAGS